MNQCTNEKCVYPKNGEVWHSEDCPLSSQPQTIYEYLYHAHCFEDEARPDHAKHLRCCLCEKNNTTTKGTTEPLPTQFDTAQEGEPMKWESEYDEKFSVIPGKYTHIIKGYITNLLTEARKDVTDEIYAKLPKKEFPGYDKDDTERAFAGGRNSAIDQIQELLKPSDIETSTDGPTA